MAIPENVVRVILAAGAAFFGVGMISFLTNRTEILTQSFENAEPALSNAPLLHLGDSFTVSLILVNFFIVLAAWRGSTALLYRLLFVFGLHGVLGLYAAHQHQRWEALGKVTGEQATMSAIILAVSLALLLFGDFSKAKFRTNKQLLFRIARYWALIELLFALLVAVPDARESFPQMGDGAGVATAFVVQLCGLSGALIYACANDTDFAWIKRIGVLFVVIGVAQTYLKLKSDLPSARDDLPVVALSSAFALYLVLLNPWANSWTSFYNPIEDLTTFD